jgi:outer membrane protein TolC
MIQQAMAWGRWKVPMLTAVAPLIAITAVPLHLMGQTADAAAPTAPLTLEEALRRAEAENPRYRQSVNELSLSRIDRSDAWLSLLPTPHISAFSTSMSWNLQTVAQNIFGEFEENPNRRMIQSSSSAQRFGVTLFFDFRNVVNLWQQALEMTVREATVITEQGALQAEVTAAFLTAQEREGQLAVEDWLVQQAEQALEVTRRLYALARRDRLDVLAAEIELADREHQRERAQSDAEAAHLALRHRMGAADWTRFALAPIPFKEIDLASLNEETLVQEALIRSPRVRQALVQQARAERGIASHRARWLPTVSVSMNTARQAFERDGGGAFFQPDPGGDWSRNFVFQFNLPDLGQGLRIRNDLNRARVGLQQQAETVRQVQLDVEQEVRSLLRDLRQGERDLALEKRRADLADERLALQGEVYGMGRGSFLELQNALQQAAAARRTILQTQYTLERTRLGLERVLGRPLDG